jgi:ABC-type branched-subunit amino acid transport system ATPase component
LDAHNVEPIVRVDGLSKTYGRVHALEGVGFSIHAGEILGLIGPNGAGTTTLFERVAGLAPADEGRVSGRSRRYWNPLTPAHKVG